jgi:hypothetical protein
MSKRTPDEVLKALLSVEDKPEASVHMKRFGVDFQIQALDGDVINRIQDQATYYTGKGNNRKQKTDEQKFGALIIQKACLVPDFSNQQLLDKYNTHDATDVIRKRLLAGEIAFLSAEIMTLSGFDDGTEPEELKNSSETEGSGA